MSHSTPTIDAEEAARLDRALSAFCDNLNRDAREAGIHTPWEQRFANADRAIDAKALDPMIEAMGLNGGAR